MMSKNDGNMLTGVYVGFVVFMYVLVGVLEITIGFGLGAGFLEPVAYIFHVVGDPFNGFILVVIGSVFLRGAGSVSRGDRVGVSFVAGGALMASVLLGFYILNAFSNGLGFALGFEDWLEWTILDDIKPGVVLWLAVVPSILLARDPKWRD